MNMSNIQHRSRGTKRSIDNSLRWDREGTALLLVLGFIAVLTIGSGTLVTLFHLRMSQTRTEERRQVCMGLAEAGLDKALAELRTQRGGYTGEKESSLGDGFFSVEVLPGDSARSFRITSTGFLGNGNDAHSRARVTAEVALAADGHIRKLLWAEVRSW